ncbi:MAG: hypothetical protein PHE55_23030 [Methylococcaceae bacterium]|nr:hypothetical protein [Methylococcaceae bacterium]
MKDALLVACLHVLLDKLPVTSGEWVITGGAALQLRGIIWDARDIDILATPEFAKAAATSLSDYIVLPLATTEAVDIRSLFAQYQINGVVVEIMADVYNLLADGAWHPHRQWQKHIEQIEMDDTSIPLLTLAYEEQIAGMLGHNNRYKLIHTQRKWDTMKRRTSGYSGWPTTDTKPRVR